MKKHLFRAAMLVLTGTLVLSCSNEESEISTVKSASYSEAKLQLNSKETLKKEFASALSKALKESPELRSLIKQKALQQFNNDTEVLYDVIKNEIIGEMTVRELVSSFYKNPENLIKLDNSARDLTILVPTLPEESFSAKIWNVSDVPAVAVRLDNFNEVPTFMNDGSEVLINGKYIPSFPVIVVKDNERVVSSDNSQFRNLKTESVKGADYEFKFLDEAFDGVSNSNARFVKVVNEDPKIESAYETYLNSDGWHRDQIYYDLTPTNTTRPFNYDYQEHISSFQMLSGTASYSKISDQTGDPNPRGIITSLNSSHWTDGNFEFKIKALINAKNGIGAEVVKYFSAAPGDLFILTYQQNGPFYVLTDILPTQKSLSLPIFNWDLNEYASTVKYEIEEVDLTVTTTITDTRVVKFATNFSVDAGFEFIVKVGLKFGASLETTNTSTVVKSYTQGNDELGEVIVNFADKIIIDKKKRFFQGWSYQHREYSSGWYSITVDPKKVQ